MTNEPSPRPWRVVAYEDGSGQCDIYDANGTPVCTMGHIADQPEADAALIVTAVNERDRLRDIVKRLLVVRENVFWRRDEKTGLLFESRTIDEEYARKTIEEARAAIGEDKE